MEGCWACGSGAIGLLLCWPNAGMVNAIMAAPNAQTLILLIKFIHTSKRLLVVEGARFMPKRKCFTMSTAMLLRSLTA